MNNDDVKKFINISNLYTEVLDLNEKKQVDENWFTDKIKDVFGITDDQATEIDKTAKKTGIDTENPEGKDAKKTGIDPSKLANPSGDNTTGTVDPEASGNVEPRPGLNMFGGDIDQRKWDKKYGDTHNTDGTPKSVQNPDGSATTGIDSAEVNPKTDADITTNKTFDSINDAQEADDLEVGDIITIDGIESEVKYDQPSDTRFYVHPGTDTSITEPKPKSDGSVDAVGSEEDPTVTDQEGGVAQGIDQVDAATDDATQEPVNTKDLMTRYNEGGKKAMPEIKKLQTELSRLGFDPNGIDGKYGNGTYAAVQAFQKANGLTVDGQAGTNTLAAIEKAINPNAGSGKDADGVPLTVAPGTGKDGPAGGAKSGVETDPNDAMSADNQQKDINTAQPNADLARYIELLNKLEGGQQNAGTPNATQGKVVASYDFRDLMTLVENKLLNEQLTKAEMEELKALHTKVQGHVGVDTELDDKITAQLNRYLKLVKEPASTASQASVNTKVNQKSAAPKVSKESYIQMAPDRDASLANFNVSKMKAKYPKPYVDMPQADGTVHRGYGPLVNLENFVKNNSKLKAKIIGKPAQQAGAPGGQPTEFKATHFHKNNFGLTNSLMLHTDNKFYFQKRDQETNKKVIAPWQGNVNNRSALNPASVDGEIVNGKKIEYPEGTTFSKKGNTKKPAVQTASKDNNMKKAIREASMNISINGDSAAEVAELAGILKNAGMPDAKPVSDILPRPGEKPAMAMDSPVRSVPGGAAFDLDYDGHDDMVAKMKMMDEPAPDDSPCGMGEEGVEEDSWDNSPDETYADTQTMTKDLSGGLNRQKKSYPKVAGGDNPMAVETSIKEQLWAALNEKMIEGDKKRGKMKTLKASRGYGEDIKTTEGSKKGKESRGNKKKDSRG